MDQFADGAIDEVVLVYNRFKNAATQIVQVEPYLPIVSDIINGSDCRFTLHET